MSAHQNTAWQTWVRELLGRGFGVEDIALKTKCDPAHVRSEIKILRQEGRLRQVLRPRETPQ